ncbi:MAG: ABC transporter permease [Bryobacteraceae bacterium]
MSILNLLASLRKNLFTGTRVERELDDELRTYLAQVTQEKVAAGMEPAQAARAARLALGGLEQVKEEVRAVRAGGLLTQLAQDLRYGLRTLRKNLSFTVVAVLALAVGTGATTAMFSVAYGVLLRPLPYPEADRVAVVYMRYYPRDFAFGTMCVKDYLTWKENNHVFEEPSLFRGQRFDVGGKEGVPEQVQGGLVTAGFFNTLGVRPLAGRTFAAGEDRPGSASLAVLSEGIWRRRFGGRPEVVGETILVNGAPTTVIGVTPVAFPYPGQATEIWTNLRLAPPTRFGPWFYRGIGRLKAGVTLAQAEAELNNVGLLLMQQNPQYQRVKFPVLSLRQAVVGPTLQPAILVLAGAVGLVLLIAVVNVANLMLARATVRRREMALRLSLGASKARLVRQLLTESVLLALVGGGAGLLLAWGGVELVRVWNPGNLPMIESVRLDAGAFAFMGFVSLFTGILFGLAPALESAKADLNATIKDGGRGGGTSRARGRMRAVLVVSEIAISLMLLVGAGLLLRSFANLQSVSGGLSTPPQRILTMMISPGNAKYGEAPAGLAFYDEVLRRVRGVAGVELAAVGDSLPPDRQGDADTFQLEDRPLAPGAMNPVVSVASVGPDYFRALGVPLLRGRYFDDHDKADAAPVAIVSEGFAKHFFPGEDAVGKRMKQSAFASNSWLQIVGVTGNLKYLGLNVDTDPAYYMPFAQTYGSRMFLVVRTKGDAARLGDELRRTVQSVDAGVTIAETVTMEEALGRSVSEPRFDTILLALFAGIALLLAAIGTYGLISYSVAQRTQEIGVRMALGAAQMDVLRMVVGQGAVLGVTGIAIGLGGALALTRLLKAMLFGVGATDVATFAAAPLALLVAVLAATVLPALRAMRVSPVVALRDE